MSAAAADHLQQKTEMTTVCSIATTFATTTTTPPLGFSYCPPSSTDAAAAVKDVLASAWQFAPTLHRFETDPTARLADAGQWFRRATLYTESGQAVSDRASVLESLIDTSRMYLSVNQPRNATRTTTTTGTTTTTTTDEDSDAAASAAEQVYARVFRSWSSPTEYTWVLVYYQFYAENGCSNQMLVRGGTTVEEFVTCDLAAHEGDWETVMVDVCSDLSRVVRVRYHAHDFHQDTDCRHQGECEFDPPDSHHPVSMVAFQSHANYPRASRNIIYRSTSLRFLGLDALHLVDRTMRSRRVFRPRPDNVVLLTNYTGTFFNDPPLSPRTPAWRNDKWDDASRMMMDTAADDDDEAPPPPPRRTERGTDARFIEVNNRRVLEFHIRNESYWILDWAAFPGRWGWSYASRPRRQTYPSQCLVVENGTMTSLASCASSDNRNFFHLMQAILELGDSDDDAATGGGGRAIATFLAELGDVHGALAPLSKPSFSAWEARIDPPVSSVSKCPEIMVDSATMTRRLRGDDGSATVVGLVATTAALIAVWIVMGTQKRRRRRQRQKQRDDGGGGSSSCQASSWLSRECPPTTSLLTVYVSVLWILLVRSLGTVVESTRRIVVGSLMMSSSSSSSWRDANHILDMAMGIVLTLHVVGWITAVVVHRESRFEVFFHHHHHHTAAVPPTTTVRVCEANDEASPLQRPAAPRTTMTQRPPTLRIRTRSSQTIDDDTSTSYSCGYLGCYAACTSWSVVVGTASVVAASLVTIVAVTLWIVRDVLLLGCAQVGKTSGLCLDTTSLGIRFRVCGDDLLDLCEHAETLPVRGLVALAVVYHVAVLAVVGVVVTRVLAFFRNVHLSVTE